MKHLAQIENYQLLTPLPDLRTNKTGEINELPGYIPNLFNIIIGLSAVIAVGWIIWGGVEYMTSDSWMGKDDGRKRIKNAVIGLVIILCSYLILFTINPRILDLELSIDPVEPIAPGTILIPTAASGNLQTYIGSTCQNCSPTRTDLNYQLSPSYIASLSCTTCQPIGSNVPLGTNTNSNILPDTNTKLQDLTGRNNNISWYVSEAYPPVVQHASSCHRTGSCVDANFGASTPPTATNINRFISNAQASGLRAVYEVQTEPERQQLVANGVPAGSIIVVPTINRNHFSVYNCTAQPQSC